MHNTYGTQSIIAILALVLLPGSLPAKRHFSGQGADLGVQCFGLATHRPVASFESHRSTGRPNAPAFVECHMPVAEWPE